MKKIFVISVCIFFLFSLITFAQNDTNMTAPAANMTAPANATLPSAGNATNASNAGNATMAVHPAAPPLIPPAVPRNHSQQNIPDCGNGKVDAGENCFSCARDVKCLSGQQCNHETGKCDTIINFRTYIIVGIGIFVLLGLFFFAKRLMKTREKQSFSGPQKSGGFSREKEEPVQLPRQMPQQAPAALQGQKPLGQAQQPPLAQPSATSQQPVQPSPVANAKIQLPPGMARSSSMPERAAEQKETDNGQGFQEMSQAIDEHPGETMPQKFIRQMREKGWNDERIRMKMKESGWSETQIALEFLKAPKFIRKQ
ncbi:MAG: hypothetical protein QME12_02325 [Nanoarchaeota archaeon]|nr:hypothetical protein [Nanoarchaeota archaeon]